MSWYLIALIPPALYVATNLLDVVLIRKVVGEVAFGALIFFTGISYAILTTVAYFLVGSIPVFESVNWWSLLGGFLWTVYLIPYYQAMGKYEPDIAVSYFALIPVFLVMLGYFVLGEELSLSVLAGIVLVCFGVWGATIPNISAIASAPQGLVMRMAIAAFTVALGMIAFKLGGEVPFWHNTFYFALGAFTTVLLVYSIPRHRRQLVDALQKAPAAFFAVNIVNEVLDQTAGTVQRFAQTLGPTALIQAVGAGVQPFYALVGWMLLSSFSGFTRNGGRGSEWRRAGYLALAGAGVILIYAFSSASDF